MDSNQLVPVWERYVLTIREASEYFGIGPERMREVAEENEDSDFVIKVGSHYRIKRKNFEKYLELHTVF